MIEIIVSIFEQGLIYGIVALGVYISYSILDFPDLSTDGTFPLGAAVCITMLSGGANPYLTLLIAFLAGCLAGAMTGFFHVVLRIKDLLCGILTMTALYSINYRIAGSATLFLSMDSPTIFSTFGTLLPNFPYAKLLLIVLTVCIAKLLLDWYLRTKSGFLLRSAGDNEKLVVTLAQNPGTIKIIGLALANGLIALAGAINCHYTRQFAVGGGTGTVVMGLAAVIIGTTVFGKIKFMRKTTGVIFGMVIYKACTYAALSNPFLQPSDTNLVITLLFVITLIFDVFVLQKQRRSPDAESTAH